MWTRLGGDAAHADADNYPPEPPISSSPAPDSSSPALVWDLTDVHSESSTSGSSPLDNGGSDDFIRRLDELLLAVLRRKAEEDLKSPPDNHLNPAQRGSNTSENELQRDSPSTLPNALFALGTTKLVQAHGKARSRTSYDSKRHHQYSLVLGTPLEIPSNHRRSSRVPGDSPIAHGGSDISPTITTIETEQDSRDTPVFASPSPSMTVRTSRIFQNGETRLDRDPNTATKGYRLIRRPESYLAEQRLIALTNRREALRTERRWQHAEGLTMLCSTVSDETRDSTTNKIPGLNSYSSSSTTTRDNNLSQKINTWRNSSASSEPPSKKPKLCTSFRTDTAYGTRVGFARRPASLRRAESLRSESQHAEDDKEHLYDGVKPHIFTFPVRYDPDRDY